MQEQSDEPLTRQAGLASNPAYFQAYSNLIENYIHEGTALNYRERDVIGGTTVACQALTGATANTCNALRAIPANPNASADTDVYLYQTWARPNLVNAPFTTLTDPTTGAISFTNTPAASFYASLHAMTVDLHVAYQTAAAQSGDFAGVAPVGNAFQRAVNSGIATPDMYSPTAGSDGLIDLWFDDGTHASKYGSYLSALTLFGTLTGLDPSSWGAGEQVAQDLGIASIDAVRLQRVAADQLGFAAPVPEPESVALMCAGLVLVVGFARRRQRER